tara:strand:- start:36647 stop:37153 length:507 start_codon:yes stop_codon:yes gene_type:complete
MGKSGSGKSSAGRLLAERFEVPHIRTGKICREIALLLFGNEDKSSTHRLDDALTQIDPSIFLRAALREAGAENAELSESRQGFIIDALRFESDLTLAKSHGCRIIRISAPDDIRVSRLAERNQVFDLMTDGRHRSEYELDAAAVDYEIVNDNDLDSLRAALRAIEAPN